MKRTFLTSVLIFAILATLSPASAQVITEDNFQQLGVRFIAPDFKVAPAQQGYSLLVADGYHQGGTVGSPSLPIFSATIEVPFCEDFDIKVSNAVYDEMDMGLLPMPFQAPLRKSQVGPAPIVLDSAVYATDAFVGQPMVQVKHIGIARDRNLAVLQISPVVVNPVSGKVMVCRSADITVSYRGADEARSQQLYERYHTPAFSAGQTLNRLFTSKTASEYSPVRMTIVLSSRLNCVAMRDFANWKRKQGMIVDYMVVSNGTSADTVAARVKRLYDQASPELPAPTYLLLVGDVDVLPPFESKLTRQEASYLDNDHITDLYFATWTPSDILPDCYLGRFSASDTATLNRITLKTSYYEGYDFEDDAYLGRAAIVAGVDQTWYDNPSDNGYTYADPTCDYITQYYVNAANGFNEVRYYKNNVNHAPNGVTVTGNSHNSNTASALRSYYNHGVGWINYSAHGDWNEWSFPEFTVSQVNNMSNNKMPSIMIGNCCLTNKFEKSVCFGEALLRKGTKSGAVAYVGGTNYTYWTQDFYWSVGVRNNISNAMDAQYDAQHRGAYDWLFHTHDEASDQRAINMGQVIYAGNKSVTEADPNDAMAKYYWEIYELMGDPSLMPWLGRAADMPVRIMDDHETVRVTTVPGAYVALVSDTLSLLGATYAGANGVAEFDINHMSHNAYFSISAQGYKPFIHRYSEASVGIDESALETVVSIYPNPARATVQVRAEGLKQVEVLDLAGRSVLTSSEPTLNVQGLTPGLYLVRISTQAGVVMKKLAVR